MSSNYEPLVPASLVFTESGVPFSAAFGDVYHPQWGALEQARRVFLHGNRLPERWQGKHSFTVAETGFGLGHNFLALWQAWRSDPLRSSRLHVVSFEAHPFTADDLERALLDRLPDVERALAMQLVDAWPALLPGMHRLEFEGGALTLTLVFGTVARLAKQVSAKVDAFFLDGFAPRVNPDMWSRSLFGQVARMANVGATLATWCCAGEVRRSLRDAGFLVSKVEGFGGKREITVATLRPGMGHSARVSGNGQRILLIGGGLAGGGLAHSLSLRGHEVIVLDPVFAHGVGASHQGHLAAAMTPVISRDDDLRSRLSRAGVARAIKRWENLGGDARPIACATIELAHDPVLAQERRKALADLRFPTDWVDWCDARQASEEAGVQLPVGGLRFADGCLVRPEPLLEALFGMPGVQCRVGAVSLLRQQPSGAWTALDADGRELAHADQVVLTNASMAPGLLARIPGVSNFPKVQAMQVVAGQVSHFKGPSSVTTRTILTGDGYWLPQVHGQGIGGSTYVPDAIVSQVSEQGRHEVIRKLTALLNVKAEQLGSRPDVNDGWAGWRAAVSDRLPVIGPIDGVSGLWLAIGYGSRGLSWSALAGDIIAADLNNEPLPLERELLRKIAPR